LSFHIVLLHRHAPQVRPNQWLDDSRPASITTTPEVASHCRRLAETNQPLRIHRIDWSSLGPAVCCECEVAAVSAAGDHQYQVEFKNHRILEIAPLVRPVRGQPCYDI